MYDSVESHYFVGLNSLYQLAMDSVMLRNKLAPNLVV